MKNDTFGHVVGFRRKIVRLGREMERPVHIGLPWAYVPSYGRKTTEVVEELCDED